MKYLVLRIKIAKHAYPVQHWFAEGNIISYLMVLHHKYNFNNLEQNFLVLKEKKNMTSFTKKKALSL